jgi:hypothetical protein
MLSKAFYHRGHSGHRGDTTKTVKAIYWPKQTYKNQSVILTRFVAFFDP